jgi:hypothetical protein
MLLSALLSSVWGYTVGFDRLAPAAGVTYYVSAQSGQDTNDGLTIGSPIRTISKVNALALQPGDRILFKCGDTWRGEMLNIHASGTANAIISFGAYPEACANRPILSGAQPVVGWTSVGGAVYRANLAAGANAGRFPNGINTAFRGESRLRLGRWPNLNEGDGGFASIDSQAGAVVADASLPAGNWSGAAAHIRGMRWYILNRNVVSSGPGSLTLNEAPTCWGGNCSGWGYFVNNSLLTLDQDGEWFYDSASRYLYLYSISGPPVDNEIEAAAVLKTDSRNWGLVNLGADYGQPVAYITLDNLEIRRSWRHGVASPTNFAGAENNNILIQNCVIRDVDSVGISLWTWVFNAVAPGQDGWRGGNHIILRANRIERANSFGIDTPSRQTLIESNTIADIGRIENLGQAGLGCGFSGMNCTEHGDGLRIYTDKPADSGYDFTIRYNRFERTAYNGIDEFGSAALIQNNVFVQTCITKGDCGAVRLFGGNDLASTPVHDVTITGNLILDTIGETTGCRSDFLARFGFGLYIDHYSRSITSTNNVIARSTAAGILYQDSTGQASGNLLFNNLSEGSWGAQIDVTSGPAALSGLNTNTLVTFSNRAFHVSLDSAGQVSAAGSNRYFHAVMNKPFLIGGAARSFAEWQALGKDSGGAAVLNGQVPAYELFYNDGGNPKTIALIRPYRDLNGSPVVGSLTLAAYSGQVLIPDGPAPFSLFLALARR